MKRNILLIGNWKMHKTNYQTQEYFKEFEKEFLKLNLKYIDVGIALSSIYSYLFSQSLTTIPIKAIQNVSQFDNEGAYTGEVSAKQYYEMRVNFAIIGHSERRTLFNETNAIINHKIKNCLKSNITPILCVGENLLEYKQKETNWVIAKQILEGLKDINIEKSKIIIAYEPLWAIGSNIIPNHYEINKVVNFIKKEISLNLKVLYGGSVNKKNIASIFQKTTIDGFLVGKSSLEVIKFLELINIIKKEIG